MLIYGEKNIIRLYFSAEHIVNSAIVLLKFVIILKEGIAKVQYKGQIKHKTTEEHARPIRKTERDLFKEKFRNGAKPLKHFLENFHKKETAQLISGNLDGVGKDDHVYRQIATEGRHVGRNDEDVIKSLLKNMEV